MTYALDIITDGVLIFDRALQLLFINPAGATITGFSQSSGERIEANFLNHDFYNYCREALEQQRLYCFQRYNDSQSKWFEIRIYPSVDRLIVLIQDVSEQKQAETSLQQICDSLQKACSNLEDRVLDQVVRLIDVNTNLASEMTARIQAEAALNSTNAQFVKVLERFTDGICGIDAEGRFNYVNFKAETLFKKSASELLGQNVWQLYPHSTETEFYRNCQSAIATQETVYGEAFAPQIDRWLSYSIYPNDGLSIYFQDITYRKQAELDQARALAAEKSARIEAEASEERVAFLSEMSQVLANSLDYNRAWSQVLELIVPKLADYCLLQRVEAKQGFRHVAALHRDPNKQAIVDKLCQLYPQIAKDPNSLTAQVIRSRQPILVSDYSENWVQNIQEPELLEINQQLQPHSVMLLPLIARGEFLGTLLLAQSNSNLSYTNLDLKFAMEIANRAAIALDNAELYEKAQESNRLKDEFLATVSHELRTPLNSIWGWAQMLQRRTSDDSVTQQGIDTIERKAKEFIGIVYNILDMSRIVRGKLQLLTAPVDISKILQESIQAQHRAAIAKSISINLSIEESPQIVECDPERIRQIFWHILSNAIKFTPEQGSITVHLRSEEQACIVQVSDTGQGISPQFLPHVFENFRQADGSRTRAVGGIGLGLSIVRYLVELHGGTISVESEGENLGTTVTVEIPRS